MKKAYLLLILCSIPLHPMEKKSKKRKTPSKTQVIDLRHCPYCDTLEDNLSDHMSNHHKIDPVVLPECLVAITAFNAIKDSYYSFADEQCIDCGRFLNTKKALIRHQNSKYSCPAQRNYRVNSRDSVENIVAKVEEVTVKNKIPSTPAITRPATRSSSRKSDDSDFYGDNLLKEICNRNKSFHES